MSARDDLAGIARSADDTDTMLWATAEGIADAVLAAGYRKPRTITTAEELDELPDGSAVLDDDNDVSTKHNGKWHGYETAPLDSRKLRAFAPFTVLWEPTP